MTAALNTDSELCALFAKENLPLPQLKPALQQSLVQLGPQLWNSRAALPHPEDLPAWMALARDSREDLLQIGFSGRGINSWSLHFNLVQKGLALFLQCRWGNAYDDADANRSRIEGVMRFADLLLQRCEHAEALNAMAPDERLIACFADHFPSRWQWSSEGEEWNHDGDFTLLATLGALDERIQIHSDSRH